jgi:hypothetical protein
MMKAASTSETLLNLCRSTRRNDPEDSNRHTRRRENLKSDSFSFDLNLHLFDLPNKWLF